MSTHQVPVYSVSFYKQNGDLREMRFCYLHDIPGEFLQQRVIGHDRPLGSDMFRVWDIEAEGGEGGFRIVTRSRITAGPVPTGEFKELTVS